MKAPTNAPKPPLVAKRGKKEFRAWPLSRYLIDKTKRVREVERLKTILVRIIKVM